MKLSAQFAVALFWAVTGIMPLAAQMTVVNGASFSSTPVAPGSFASIFGQDLCQGTMAGEWIAPGKLPTELSGCTVMVGGIPAMLSYVSPGQVNFIVPAGMAPGMATVMANNGSRTISGSVMSAAAGPGMFALTGMGVGEGAMLHGTLWRTGPFSVSTNGQTTYLSIYVTGLDVSAKPVVTMGGVAADVVWWGDAPGYVGLQQINIMLPAGTAGTGRVPVMVTSNGQNSNVTFMHVLPTAAMMQGMPGWTGGMTMGENMRRNWEASGMAFNAVNSTALVVDEDDDVVRVLSLGASSILATIALPSDSQAHAIAVSADGMLAAVTLSGLGSAALIDLTQNKLLGTVATGYYPAQVAFAGTNVLVTNAGSGTVSVIDSVSRAVTQTVDTGAGSSGIAVAGNTAVVANMQVGTVSIINLTDFSISNVTLAAGTRPHQVAISGTANKAVITTPMTNGFAIVDLGTKVVTEVSTLASNGIGPGAVAINGTTVYLANQMTASVTVADLSSGTVVKTLTVDPGPVALAVDAAHNRLLVLAEGTGTLDVVDLASGSVVSRLATGNSEPDGRFVMPSISSLSPSSAAAGSSFILTIAGANLQNVKSVEFHAAGAGMGMGGGGMMGGGQDSEINTSDLQVNAAGTQITVSVRILDGAATGARQIRLETDHGEMAGPITGAVFTVTQ
ncbi:MAG: IPT/TIG domain-containing protein [Bryobacteraceae bacterium]